VLLAAADRSDPAHERCRELLESHPGPLITTELVLAETGWLLDRQLARSPKPRCTAPSPTARSSSSTSPQPIDWKRIAALTEKYADQPLGGVDAGLIAVAERLGLTTIATLDRRHFGVVRPDHAEVLTLIP